MLASSYGLIYHSLVEREAQSGCSFTDGRQFGCRFLRFSRESLLWGSMATNALWHLKAAGTPQATSRACSISCSTQSAPSRGAVERREFLGSLITRPGHGAINGLALGLALAGQVRGSECRTAAQTRKTRSGKGQSMFGNHWLRMQKTRYQFKDSGFKVVARLGIEPRTQGFSVLCSTN